MSLHDKKGQAEKNTRISEKDIQKKLYGDHLTEKDDQKPIKGKFSEDFIQEKLYGTKKHEDPKPKKENKNKDLFSKEQMKQTNNIVSQNDDMHSALQEEIDALKQAIENLEEKLNRTESQKQKLKVKLLQKRKMFNVTDRLADLIFNKMPEKFIFIVSIVVIVLLISVVARIRPKKNQSDVSEPEQSVKESPKPLAIKAPEKEDKQAKVTIESLPEPDSSVGKYTIQVAEYADEQAAKAFVDDLKAKGLEVFVITIYRGPNQTRPYFKINVGAFDTFNQAKMFNQTFREKTNINDSFIRKTK
jgi:cell division septation protein DedD